MVSKKKTLAISAVNIGSGNAIVDIDADGTVNIDGQSGINIGTTSNVPIDLDSSTLDIDASGDITIDSALIISALLRSFSRKDDVRRA